MPQENVGTKAPTRFQRWCAAGYTSELLPIVPPGATIAEGSKLRAEHLGKVPGTRKADGSWSGLGGRWPDELHATLEQCQRWHKSGAGVGLQGRKCPGLDIDVSDDVLADRISELARDYLGFGPVRTRTGSARRLRMFRTDEDLRKVRLPFTYKGERAAVELLAHGQQYVVEGQHPSGAQYAVAGFCKAEDLPPITAEDVQRFFEELGALLRYDGIALEQQQTAGAAGTRRSLDDTGLHAPNPELVLELLERWQPESMAHDDFVAATSAIKAALGPTREEHYDAFLEWAPGARGNEEEATRKVWDSVRDAAVGWDWLSSKAGAGDIAAQADFDDGGAQDTDADDPRAVARAAMVDRYVYVETIERYVDLQTGRPLTREVFNTRNTVVAQYGKSGTDSAAAVFQNCREARKVPIVTYRPGRPELTEEESGGAIVPAVNVWRPSLLKPKAGDVGPWLKHMTALFGPVGTPAFEHVANWMAYVLQRPGVKINHCLVLLGEEGIGKDSVFEPLRRALGKHNAATIDPSDFMQPFNSGWIERQFLVMNEAHTFHRKETMNKLKPLLAAPPDTLQVNRKNVPQYEIPNIINVVMFTNHEDALAPSRGDRRYWIWRCILDARPAEDYFTALWDDFYDVGGDAHVFAWLLARDISRFNPKAPAPMTEAKADMIEATAPPAARWLEEQFEEGGTFAARTLLTAREIVAEASGFNGNSRAAETMRDSLITYELKRRGFHALENKVKDGGKTVRVWSRGKAPAEHRLVLHRLLEERKAAGS